MSFNELASWSISQFNHFPWRKNRTIYHTLVSEIMLQQTTVPHVAHHFSTFIEKFPNIRKLASATEEEILLEWRGLGYYRRAKNLLKGAKHIINNYSGCIPSEYSSLLRIPGVGSYTARALQAIGQEQLVLAVDANLERVLSRYYGIESTSAIDLKRKLEDLFQKRKILSNLRRWGGRILNEALMDLGREYCRANNPNCTQCFLRNGCLAKKTDRITKFPSHKVSTVSKKSFEMNLIRYLISDENKQKILVVKKLDHEWLAGQWELPTYIISSQDKQCKQYPWLKEDDIDLESFKSLKNYQSTITYYKINNYIKMISKKDFMKSTLSRPFKEIMFVSLLDIKKITAAKSVLKALNKIK